MNVDFRKTAEAYHDRYGWATTPLRLDDNGKPKRPIEQGWTSRPSDLESVLSQQWTNAAGIGIVLGEKSGGIGVLDVDDPSLFMATILMFDEPPMWVRTVSGNGHIYIQQNEPVKSTAMRVQWKGRAVSVELKSTGTQVAAPPSPGYAWMAKGKVYPDMFHSLEDVADLVFTGLRMRYEDFSFGDSDKPVSGFPKAWKEEVPSGERNESIYIEAHRLREAGMLRDQAIDIMLERVRQGYQTGQISEAEVIRTVKSAYTKGEIPNVLESKRLTGTDSLLL